MKYIPWISSILFLLFCAGVFFYTEVYPVFKKVECPIPIGYTLNEVYDHFPDEGIFGFQTEDVYITVRNLQFILINVYGFECIELYRNLYWAGGRKDHELRKLGKELESI